MGVAKAGGVRPQLLVTVDLDSLLGDPDGVGGDLGWAGPLDREGCRRLACDSAVTQVLVTRHPSHQHPSGHGDHGSAVNHDPSANDDPGGDHSSTVDHDPGAEERPGTGDPTGRVEALQERLRAAMAVLPPTLGGAPSQPLDVGQATRVIKPAQRAALAVRDSGCVFPGCDRPPGWCDAHHLVSWLDGGPTDLWNLAMVCRAHHRAVHEGGWQLLRGPDGRFTVTPSRRSHRAAA